MSLFGKKPEQQSKPTSTPAKSSAAVPKSPDETPDDPPEAVPAAPEPGPATAKAPAPAGARSYLGAGCEFVGDLSGEGSFECGGDFEGTIDISGDLVVSPGGTAKAELKARRIDIEGRLQGNATGLEKVEVGASGHVEGDVRAPAVQFAEGAFFEGNVEMRRAKGASTSPGGDGDPAGEGSTGKGDEAPDS